MAGDGDLADFDDFKQQLIDMQSQLAYQEHTVQALNEALAGQQQDILVLRQQLQLLKQRQDEQAAGSSDSGPEEGKPPHY